MKIEDKKNNNFIAALLNLEMPQIQAVRFDVENRKSFKEIVGNALRTKKMPDAHFMPYNFGLGQLTKEDINFFKLCAENKELTISNVSPKDSQVTIITPQEGPQQVSYKTVNFSKGLFNLIEYSFKTQKPVRLDFQGNSSVILKINTEGKLTAEFISNDAAMEYALKSSIPALKHKMDSEGIPYEKICYKDDNKQQNNKKKRNKGGNR